MQILLFLGNPVLTELEHETSKGSGLCPWQLLTELVSPDHDMKGFLAAIFSISPILAQLSSYRPILTRLVQVVTSEIRAWVLDMLASILHQQR